MMGGCEVCLEYELRRSRASHVGGLKREPEYETRKLPFRHANWILKNTQDEI